MADYWAWDIRKHKVSLGHFLIYERKKVTAQRMEGACQNKTR